MGMLLKLISFLAINLQIISGRLYLDEFRFKENLAQILTGIPNPFDNEQTATFLNKLRNSTLPMLDAYNKIWGWGLDKRLDSRLKESFRSQCMQIGNPINESTDFDANENVTIFSNFMFRAYIKPFNWGRSFNYYFSLLKPGRSINLEPKIVALKLNNDERKKYLCSGFKVLNREFDKFNDMPAKISFNLNFSTTIKSILRKLHNSTRKISNSGIRKMTYNESKEFFKLVRLIQECYITNDCWPFVSNSTKLRFGIIEANFTGIKQHHFSKLRSFFTAIYSRLNLTMAGKHSIQPYDYEKFSVGFDYSQFYNESQFVNCSDKHGLRNQVECLNLL